MVRKAYIWLAILTFTVIVLDSLIGFYNKTSFSKITHGIYGSINQTIISKQPILILGSSTAQSHYNPDILSASTSLSAFNGGIGGYGIFLNYALLKERIKYSSPKILILDISPNIIVDPLRYEKLSKLTPYYEVYPSFKEIINLNRKYRSISTFSNALKYNSTFYNSFRSFISRNVLYSDNGYEPIYREIKGDLETPMTSRRIQIDSMQIYYFNRIIDLCIKNDIKLYVFISPAFIPFDSEGFILESYEELCKRNRITYQDFSSNNEFNKNRKVFADQIHLNNDGATMFTNLVSSIIKDDLQED